MIFSYAYSLSDFRLDSGYIIYSYAYEKRAFSLASFDSLRSSTTLLVQIYAQKTHANT